MKVARAAASEFMVTHSKFKDRSLRRRSCFKARNTAMIIIPSTFPQTQQQRLVLQLLCLVLYTDKSVNTPQLCEGCLHHLKCSMSNPSLRHCATIMAYVRIMPKCNRYTVVNVRTRSIHTNYHIKNAPIGFCTRLLDLDSTWHKPS